MQSYFQDGYKIKLNKLEHCDSKAIYKITNLKVELTKECSVFFKGCVELTAAITSLRVCWNARSVLYVTVPLNTHTLNMGYNNQLLPLLFPACVLLIAGRAEGPGIESRWGRDFLHLSRPALGPTQSPIQWVPGLFPGDKAAGLWR